MPPFSWMRSFTTGFLLGGAMLVFSGCDRSGADDETVLTIGRDGQIVEADEIDELAPFDPASQQLIYHLSLAQAEEYVRRFPDSIIFDIRPRDQFEAGHLPGATHAEWLHDKEVFQMLVGQLPKEDKYLIYGSTAMVADTAEAIVRLRTIGFQNLHTFYESYEAWQAASLPFEQGPDPDPLPLPDPPREEYVEGVSEPELKDHWDMWRRSKAYVDARDGNPAGTEEPTVPPATDIGAASSNP